MAPLPLEQALIRYDRMQSTKRYYNPHALGIYLQRAEEVQERAATMGLAAAICDGFSDRLCDFILKQMGLERPQ